MKPKFKFSQHNWLRCSMIITLLLCLVGQAACSAAKTPKLNNTAAKSTKGKIKHKHKGKRAGAAFTEWNKVCKCQKLSKASWFASDLEWEELFYW